MEVDRISQMGGVAREAAPAWPAAKRKRRFTLDMEPEVTEETEDSAENEPLTEPEEEPAGHFGDWSAAEEEQGEDEDGGTLHLMA